MMSEEDTQNTPHISTLRTRQTARPFLGTKLRQSCSATKLGTPSGEVVFNFRRQGHRREDQADLPLGRNSSKLSFTRGETSEPEKTAQ